MSTSDNSRKNFSPLRILGWLTGALSSLHLIEELSPVKIYGYLKKWLEAYTGFVEKIGNFLFGWIDFYWLEISEIEMHIIVITSILTAAYCRAYFHFKKSNGHSFEVSFFYVLGFGVSWLLPVLISSLLLPSRFGTSIAGFYLFLIIIRLFNTRGTGKDLPTQKAVFNELVGITAVFLFLIALNYTVFKSWS